jgi:hypothetical protein
MGNKPSTVSYDPDERLHEAIASFELARDNGRNPDPQKWLDDYPDVATRLAAHFRTQQEIERRAGLLLPSIPGYEILAALKEGGMGVVYRARQVALDRPAAVKMIREELLTDAGVRERFRVEAKAVARLDHPNIVRVYESGEADGRPYFALEFVAGGSLAEWRRPGPCPPRAAAQLLAQVADAVEYAHNEGVLHRDLKPANILLQPRAANGGEDGSAPGSRLPLSSFVPKVSDFGLARLLQRDAAAQTQPGARLGTPGYMAPEAAAGRVEAVGRPADVFGLGAILYHLLTGRPPFEGASADDVLEQARRGRVTPPRQLNPDVPPALERICLKALATDPRARYPSAAALAGELRRYLRRPLRRALAAAVGAGLLLLGILLWVLAGALGRPEPPLSGDLIVRLWAEDGRARQGLRVDERGTLPARHGDRVRLEARLNRAAHVYLLWLDGEGKVNPLYPWNDRKLVRDLSAPPPELGPHAVVHSPTGEASARKGWKLDRKSGLETVLLLARPTPLPPDVRLARLIGKPAPVPLRDPLELAVRGFDAGQPVDFIRLDRHRGLEQEAAEIDDPLLRLMGRLQPHFEVVRAVRFAHEGDK